jgi:hypothetical protein
MRQFHCDRCLLARRAASERLLGSDRYCRRARIGGGARGVGKVARAMGESANPVSVCGRDAIQKA